MAAAESEDLTVSEIVSPHPARRRTPLLTFGLLLVALLGLSACSPAQNAVLDDINATRAEHGLPALLPSPHAMTKAQAWAEHLVELDGLEHSDLAEDMPDGWRRLGENVGYGPDDGRIHAGFLDSPGHRANILDPEYNWAGTGHAVSPNGRTFIVHLFATY